MSASLSSPWPRRPRRLATAVVEELVDWLVSDGLSTGDSLPTEPALCETFGVSRTVVREAVKALEAMRMVTVQQGQGTRVRPLADWDLLNPTVLSAVVRHDAGNVILGDLVDVRRALEGQMAGQAATNSTPAERAAISERMATLDASIGDATAYLAADVAFHDEIMAASRNRLGRAIIHTLTDEAYRSLRYVGDPSAQHIRLTNEAHQRVHDAVVAGDAVAAQRAMDEHILESWQRRRPENAPDQG